MRHICLVCRFVGSVGSCVWLKCTLGKGFVVLRKFIDVSVLQGYIIQYANDNIITQSVKIRIAFC